jgi:hypothetical protein
MNNPRSTRQDGQAMVEALIAAALVMVPLFLAIPIIAKYMDIRPIRQAARCGQESGSAAHRKVSAGLAVPSATSGMPEDR